MNYRNKNSNSNNSRLQDKNITFIYLIFIIVHLPLASLMRSSSSISTFHAVVVFLIGLYFAFKDESHERISYAIGYITGSDILWRMTDAAIFWEYGKYSFAFLLIIFILKSYKKGEIRKAPFFFFLLLIPAIIVPLSEFPLNISRKIISFNLSGPLCLSLAVIFFSNYVIERKNLSKFLIFLIAPIAGIFYLAFTGLTAVSSLKFTTESMHATSGGFGPNQVSNILGLGAVCCFVLLVHRTGGKIYRISFALLFLSFLAQAIVTFSRGGVLAAIISCFVGSLYLLRNRKTKWAVISLALIFIISAYFILPKMDEYTQGKLAERYEDLNTTGRLKLALYDFDIFLENPIFGVGLGQLRFLHANVSLGRTASHTEFSRILGEHGIFGLLALVIFFFILLRRYKEIKEKPEMFLFIIFACWSILYMGTSGMRNVAPAAIIGLSMAKFKLENNI